MTNTRKKITDKEKSIYLLLIGLLCLVTLLVRKCSRNSEEKVLENPVPVTSSQTYTPPAATHNDSTRSYTPTTHSKTDPYDAGYAAGYESGYEDGLFGDYSDYGFSYDGEKDFKSGDVAQYRQGYDVGYQDGYDDGHSDRVAEKERRYGRDEEEDDDDE